MAGIAAAALAASALPGPAQAKVQIGTGQNGSYRLKVMSWAEIPFRSVVAQRYDFSCGSAAVATLLTYHYDRPTPERTVFATMWAGGDQPTIRKLGFSMLDIKRYLDGLGLKTEGYRLTVDQLAAVRRPGIIILNFNGYKHFVVVKGIGRGKVLVGDPMRGLTQYSMAEVASRWNGILLTVSEQPGQPRPRFNQASEWSPWANAPVDQVEMSAPVADLTRALPSLYLVRITVSGNATP